MIRSLVCVLLLWLAVAPGAWAQVYEPPTGRVVEVQVEGVRRLEPFVVLSAVNLGRGDELSASRVRRDLKSVYDTGFFDDVRVSTREADGGVILVFTVVEKPAIRQVLLEGHKKLDDEDLREVLDIRAFSVLNSASVERNRQRLHELYVEKGYFLADIQPRVVEVSESQVDLVFDITENRKVVVADISFTGNEHMQASRMRRFMQTKQGGAVPWLTSRGSFQEADLTTDLDTIRFLYWEEGYWEVGVRPPNVFLSPDKRSIHIAIHVDEGIQYSVGQVQITGDFSPEEGLTEEAVRRIVMGEPVVDVQEDQWRAATGRNARPLRVTTTGPSLTEGETFSYTNYRAVSDNITAFYEDQGYAQASVGIQPITNPDTATMDFVVQIQKGEKMRIGRIDIVGNDPTYDKVVRREIQLAEGDVYRGTLRRASEMRIQRLGYFDQVRIDQVRGSEPGTIDLDVRVSEQPTGSFQFGAGYSSAESIILNGSMSKQNFMGLGYTASASINWSRRRKLYSVSLSDPYFLDSRWSASVDVFNRVEQFQINQFNRGGSLGIGRWLDPRDDVRLTATYTFEMVGLNNISPVQKRIAGGDLFRNGLTSTLGLNLSVDKRNNRIRPTRGWLFSSNLALSGGFRVNDEQVLSLLGGDFNFVETRANFRFYWPLEKSETFIFRANTTLGRVWSTDGRSLPFIHRYRAGGIYSVRGFSPFSLGPSIRGINSDDPDVPDSNIIVGGTETWVNNFEIESHFLRAAGISGVVFFDAGNTFGDPWDNGHINPLGLRTAIGAGIRWQSPMGPLRFEYGIPLAPREGERKGLFDFGIGGFF